jgi:hypothetical protein
MHTPEREEGSRGAEREREREREREKERRERGVY